MFKDKLFAMALKVKSQDDKTQMLYMQLDVLTELLTILKSRYRGVHKRAEEEGEEPELNLLADGRQSKCHYPLDDAGRPTL
jgi:hypothetical protein